MSPPTIRAQVRPGVKVRTEIVGVDVQRPVRRSAIPPDHVKFQPIQIELKAVSRINGKLVVLIQIDRVTRLVVVRTYLKIAIWSDKLPSHDTNSLFSKAFNSVSSYGYHEIQF